MFPMFSHHISRKSGSCKTLQVSHPPLNLQHLLTKDLPARIQKASKRRLRKQVRSQQKGGEEFGMVGDVDADDTVSWLTER